MKRAIPNIPSGSGKAMSFFQWVREEILASRIADSPDLVVERTSKGTKLRLKSKPKAGKASADNGYWQ